jgi:hypothetical protein
MEAIAPAMDPGRFWASVLGDGISGGYVASKSARAGPWGEPSLARGDMNLEKTKGKKSSPAVGGQVLEKRSWMWSVAVSVAVVGVGIVISATVNPLFDRAVHWDWMAVLAPALLIGLAVALRNRWA